MSGIEVRITVDLRTCDRTICVLAVVQKQQLVEQMNGLKRQVFGLFCVRCVYAR